MINFDNGKMVLKITNKALNLIFDFLNSRVGLAIVVAFIFGVMIWPEIKGFRSDLQQLVISANRTEALMVHYQGIPERIAEIKALIIAYSDKGK